MMRISFKIDSLGKYRKMDLKKKKINKCVNGF